MARRQFVFGSVLVSLALAVVSCVEPATAIPAGASPECLNTCIGRLDAIRFESSSAAVCARIYDGCHASLSEDDRSVPRSSCEDSLQRLDRFQVGYLESARCRELRDVGPLANPEICRTVCTTPNVELACVVYLEDDAFLTSAQPCGVARGF